MFPVSVPADNWYDAAGEGNKRVERKHGIVGSHLHEATFGEEGEETHLQKEYVPTVMAYLYDSRSRAFWQFLECPMKKKHEEEGRIEIANPVAILPRIDGKEKERLEGDSAISEQGDEEKADAGKRERERCKAHTSPRPLHAEGDEEQVAEAKKPIEIIAHRAVVASKFDNYA